MSQENEKKFLKINGSTFEAPARYCIKSMILTNSKSSIPLLRITPKLKKAKSTIIFSHGNGSDISHSAYFIKSLTYIHEAEYIAYDYSGYGES